MAQVMAIGAGLFYGVYAIATMNFPFSVYYILSNEMKLSNWISFLVLILMKPILVMECFGEIYISLVAFYSIFSTVFWTKRAW